MKKKMLRLFCCLAAACGMFAFSGCSDFLDNLFGDDSSDGNYAEDEWNPGKDPTESNASVGTGDSGEQGGDTDLSQPKDPDPDKELAYTETNDIGHKIAYYADGTCEDLGRITPIDLTPASPAKKEGYQYFATLEKADGLCAFYEEIFNVAYNFHTSGKNVVSSGGYYEIADMRFSQHGLTDDEAVSVWRVASMEYPEFFWWGNAVLLGKTSLTFLIDPVYAQASERETAQAAVENMIDECDSYLDGTASKVERALTIHDYVSAITEYAYEDDYVTPESEIWAHNIVGGALYGKGVCENYAKTYDYLCELFNIPAITVTGFAVQDGESFGHAWNVIQIDGAWYDVDATWNDLDSVTLSREWFGTDPDVFAESHDAFSPEDGWCVDYMFALPTLDEEGLTPVRAANAEDIDSGKYTAETAPMYPSIEDVCALVGAGTTYEIYLYPKTDATSAKASVLPQGATLDRMPYTAGTVVINGSYRTSFGGYYEMASLSSPDPITVAGDLVLRNVSYTAPKITLIDGTLTTVGTAAEITTTEGLFGGDIIDKTTDWTDIYGAVQVQSVTAQGEELRLLGGGTIVKANIHSGVLRLSGTKDVSITALWYATATERLYIDGGAETTKITIGDITAGTSADEETGTAAIVPEKVTVFVAYDYANSYPIISVAKKSTDATLYLQMYSEYKTPTSLGKPFINLGEDVPLSSLTVAYTWRGITREFAQSYYEKQENGDVCLK